MGMSSSVRAIDEIHEQKHKDGLVCPYCDTYSVVRFGRYAVKTRAGEVKRQRDRIRTTKLDEAIGGHLSDSNVLCTDSWRTFSSHANAKGLAHYRFKSDGKQRVKGVYHIQNVNSYHSRLKKWMDRFNDVATKYLQHYLAWFHYIDSKEYENTTSNKKNMLVESCLYLVHVTNKSLRIAKTEV